MNLQELKQKNPAELINEAEKLGIENPSTLRKQEILFAILKKLAEKNEQITATGVLEVLQDGFGFLRAIESNYLPGPDDIYVSPSQIRRFGLRTGDSVEGEIRGPKDAERYFALLKVNKINFDEPEKGKNKIAFDNLTPLYPNERIKLGGFVVEGSISKDGGYTVFTITDGNKEIDILFDGFIPELFQENMGVILDGVLDNNIFFADDMLVKHDNEYVSSDGETYDVKNYSK